MKKFFLFIGLFISVISFVACDVEFSPNEEWSEQMMVYSVLDQDDDTTFVRIQKVFLGSGNALEYAKDKDSVYYPEDALEVKMYSYYISDTNTVVDVFNFDCKMVQKDEGDFCGGMVPLYYCVTKNRLSADKYYRLEIINKNTGTKVTASTYLITDYSIKTNNFTFNENSGNRMSVRWSNMDLANADENVIAKRFQVNIRFNYRKDYQIHHVDIPVVAKTNERNTSAEMSGAVNKNDIVTYLREKLHGVEGISWYDPAPFEINVLACDREMFDYISINNAVENTLNYKPSYTNINGGFGLFASRRTHISKSYSTPQVDQDLRTKLNGVITFQ